MPARSDVDILVVATSGISAEKRAITDAILRQPYLSGVWLELSAVTSSSARTESDAPPFECHIRTAEGVVVDDGGSLAVQIRRGAPSGAGRECGSRRGVLLIGVPSLLGVPSGSR